MKTPRLAALPLALCLILLGFLTPSSALATGHQPVDESRLVPALSPTFVPWICKAKGTGPVCKGERHLEMYDWAPNTEFPCAVPVWEVWKEDTYQTRYHNHDYLNYYRDFRTNQITRLSTSPTGAAAGSIRTKVRYFETFDIPGDDKTRTITSVGVGWDIRAAQGPALFRTVGVLVEPYNAPATFTGTATRSGVTTRYHNAPLDEVLPEDVFFEAVCEASGTEISR